MPYETVDKSESQRIYDLEQSVKRLNAKMTDVETKKDPLYITRQMVALKQDCNDIRKQNTALIEKINALNLDDKYLELFKDDEIKELYIQSGLSQQEVKEFLIKNVLNEQEKTEITGQGVSDYCNGKIKGLRARSKIGKYFRNAFNSR